MSHTDPRIKKEKKKPHIQHYDLVMHFVAMKLVIMAEMWTVGRISKVQALQEKLVKLMTQYAHERNWSQATALCSVKLIVSDHFLQCVQTYMWTAIGLLQRLQQ
jgi:hypothetical protein